MLAPYSLCDSPWSSRVSTLSVGFFGGWGSWGCCWFSGLCLFCLFGVYFCLKSPLTLILIYNKGMLFTFFSFLWIFSLFHFQMLSPFPASLPSRNTLACPPSPCFYESVPPPSHFHLPHPWFPYIGPRTTAKHTPVKSAWQAERPGSTHKAKSFTETQPPGTLTFS